MKKALIAILVLSLLVTCGCSSSSSSDNSKPEEPLKNSLAEYPGYKGISLDTGSTVLPLEVYTQTAAENGLEGTIYYVEGTVTELNEIDGVSYFVVTTEKGNVAISDRAGYITTFAEDYGIDVDIDVFNSYFPIPSTGENVRVFAEYLGMSNSIGLPIFAYGSMNYFYEVMYRSATLTETVETTIPTEPPEPGTKENPYRSGMYKVGADLPAGEYMFTATGSTRAYVCASSDSNQDDILENENFNGSFFMTVKDGQYLEANRCEFVIASERTVEINEDSSFEDGMYRVGIDIPAGEYKLTATSDSRGYWCIYKNSVIPFDIVDNDNFDNSAYVTVREGQYLQLSRCIANPV